MPNKQYIEHQLNTMSRKLHEIGQLQTSINDLQKVIDDNLKAINVFMKNIQGELQ